MNRVVKSGAISLTCGLMACSPNSESNPTFQKVVASPLKVSIISPSTAKISTSLSNVSENPICVVYLDPFEAYAESGELVMSFLSTNYPTDLGSVVVLWPDDVFVWEEKFDVTTFDKSEYDVAGGSRQEINRYQSSIQRIVEEGKYFVRAEFTAYSCKLANNTIDSKSGYRVLAEDDHITQTSQPFRIVIPRSSVFHLEN